MRARQSVPLCLFVHVRVYFCVHVRVYVSVCDPAQALCPFWRRCPHYRPYPCYAFMVSPSASHLVHTLVFRPVPAFLMLLSLDLAP